MSLVIDHQYASMVAPYVRNFSRIKNGYRMSCPICGDSATNKSKARGYLYVRGDRIKYVCHNCSTPITSLAGFLKEIDNNLAEQYRVDTFNERRSETKYEPVVRKASFAEQISPRLTKVSSLPPNHPCKKYVVSRKIPANKHYLLYYTDDFLQFTQEVDPRIDLPLNHKREPRLVIPLVTETQEVAGYQGRLLSGEGVKYLTVLYNENNGKIFGLDRVDFNKKIYAFEGPIDALFIDNSIASTGGRIDTLIEYSAINKSNTVVIYDNEPRSKQTVEKMKKAIEAGYSVCIWPEQIRQNDANAMIRAGATAEVLKAIIDKSTYHGLEALLMLQKWRRV